MCFLFSSILIILSSNKKLPLESVLSAISKSNSSSNQRLSTSWRVLWHCLDNSCLVIVLLMVLRNGCPLPHAATPLFSFIQITAIQHYIISIHNQITGSLSDPTQKSCPITGYEHTVEDVICWCTHRQSVSWSTTRWFSPTGHESQMINHDVNLLVGGPTAGTAVHTGKFCYHCSSPDWCTAAVRVPAWPCGT